MNPDFKDVFDDKDGSLSPKSVLFFQSHRPQQRFYSEMNIDDEITPWSDAVGPKLIQQSKQRTNSQKKMEVKKRNITESSLNMTKPQIREKSIHNFTHMTEGSKEIVNFLNTTTDYYQTDHHKSQAFNSYESPRFEDLPNFIAMGNNIEHPRRLTEQQPYRMLASSGMRCAGTTVNWLPSFSYSQANSDFKKNVMVQKEMATRSNKFWMNQSKSPHPGNEEVSADSKSLLVSTQEFEKSYNRTQTEGNASLGQQDHVVPNTEHSPPQNPKISRHQSQNKGLFETRPLNGIKTELNNFHKKLSGFGLYNFEKKCKYAVEKLFVHKKDETEHGNYSATNIKLKLEILRKMNREELNKSKSKDMRPREKRDKSWNVFAGSGHTTSKTYLDQDLSFLPMDESTEVQREKMTTPTMKQKRNNFMGSTKQLDNDHEKSNLDIKQKPEESKKSITIYKSPMIRTMKTRSPDQAKSLEEDSFYRRNASFEKFVKRSTDRKFFQAYGKVESKREGESMKSPGLEQKTVVAQEKPSPKKLLRNRKYGKFSINY